MKKTLIAIPTLNESDNILDLLTKIDVAIVKLFPDKYFEIINFDSNSDDGTRSVFLETKTITAKDVVNTGRNGKGTNIIEACKYAVSNSFDYIITIDGDIRSFEDSWIEKFILALDAGADYVVPCYKRSRYEGNTTNHFCYPLIKKLYNIDIRQPIAGDFAFSIELAKKFIENANFLVMKNYGIDIFMTLTAIHMTDKIYIIDLYEKLHAPSFGKMIKMFEEVAASFFYYMKLYSSCNEYAQIINTSKGISILDSSTQISSDKIIQREQEALGLLNQVQIPSRLARHRDMILQKHKITASEWFEVLDNLLEIKDISPQVLGRLSTPFYLFRVLGYFDDIENMSAEDVDSFLQNSIK